MFRKQFLLTTKKEFYHDWPGVKIKNFTLWYHPELEYASAKMEDKEIHLLGFMYGWEAPDLNNIQIISGLLNSESLSDFFKSVSKYTGQFAIIYKTKNQFILFNDTCAQSEIYYDSQFSSFGTQPKLLKEVIDFKPYQDGNAKAFFKSDSFLRKKEFIGSTTHVENIKHLLPNHYLCLNQHKAIRFFPSDPIVPISTNEAAEIACEMITGYIKAISLRTKIAIPVTGGYDSRVLFLASLDVDSKYFVYKHVNMSDNHYDITIPTRLTSLYEKEFSIIPDKVRNRINYNKNYENSIDFPRYLNLASKYFENHVYLNGNISEVARNYYGNHKHLSPPGLAYIRGYPNMSFVTSEYAKWINENLELFNKKGYNYLDMFYWEEKMCNWAAKTRTETNALGYDVFSPFNSRDLLVTLLSTKRSQRDSHNNKLFKAILNKLGPKVSHIPINPDKKQMVIRILKMLRVYTLYRNAGIKYQFLRV